MPTFQSVALTDRTPTTPVTHTFLPKKEVGEGGRLTKAGNTSLGDKILEIEPRTTPQGRYKVDIKLVDPVVVNQTINGVVTEVVQRANRAQITFDFAPDSTEQERKDLVGMIESALGTGKVLINDTIIKQESIW